MLVPFSQQVVNLTRLSSSGLLHPLGPCRYPVTSTVAANLAGSPVGR
jgi:hypothetical protein